MSSSPPQPTSPYCPLRLKSVAGYDGRHNDVIYCHPAVESDKNLAVIFWGGDVQDYPENMEAHRDNKNYLKWNLESTALLLQSSFPQSHVVVIKAARMELKTFSCYDNFVPFNNCGAPDHTPNHFALHHLELLLQNVAERVRKMALPHERTRGERDREREEQTPITCDDSDNAVDTDDAHKSASPLSSSSTAAVSSAAVSSSTAVATNGDSALGPLERKDSSEQVPEAKPWWKESIDLDKAELTFVGFSKGCVVLNQFIYEFHYMKTLTPDDDTMMALVSRIKDMFWLDGGHAGGKNTWITSRSLLETLTRLAISIHVHVTPYQVNDDRRPWIKREEKAFSDLLRRLGAPLKRTVHFENQVANLHTHFEVLNAFTKGVK